MPAWLHDVLARRYGLIATAVSHLERGHTNESFAVETAAGPCVVRRSWRGKPAAQLAREDAVLAALAAADAPTPRVIAASDGARHVVEGARAIRVFAWIPGEPGPRTLASGDAVLVRAAMARLAALHRALATIALDAEDWLVERLARVRAVGPAGLPAGTNAALARIADAFARCPRAPAQWLHGDYHLGNLLWQGSRLAGVVDLDETGRGAVATEVAFALFALTRRPGDDRFAFDPAAWQLGLRAYTEVTGAPLDVEPDAYELAFCGYQVLIHLEAVHRGAWTLAPDIGFWSCWRALVTAG